MGVFFQTGGIGLSLVWGRFFFSPIILFSIAPFPPPRGFSGGVGVFFWGGVFWFFMGEPTSGGVGLGGLWAPPPDGVKTKKKIGVAFELGTPSFFWCGRGNPPHPLKFPSAPTIGGFFTYYLYFSRFSHNPHQPPYPPFFARNPTRLFRRNNPCLGVSPLFHLGFYFFVPQGQKKGGSHQLFFSFPAGGFGTLVIGGSPFFRPHHKHPPQTTPRILFHRPVDGVNKLAGLDGGPVVVLGVLFPGFPFFVFPPPQKKSRVWGGVLVRGSG